MKRLSLLSILCVAAAINFAPAAFSASNQIAPMVVVPDAPGGALVSGCFRADRTLFGPHTLTMCLQNRGTYTIRGGGIRCDGRLTWSTSGRNIDINLRRQSCNRGVAWEAARVQCRGRNLLTGLLDNLFNPNPRVIVPDRHFPSVRSLSCTYYPTVRGHSPTFFIANRV